jgi:UDP-N-acetyl-D-mannosaminuronic acid transferase (WecB/TagA/CpsF family)
MTDHGMDWLGRLIIEPRRLWKRYLIGIPVFFLRVFVHIILKHPLPTALSESAHEI